MALNQDNFLPITKVQSLKELYDFANNASVILNQKTNGLFNTIPTTTGQLYPPQSGSSQFDFRQDQRILIQFGALPNAGTKTVAHNIQTITEATKIYATANDTANQTYIPIPFASPTLNENISLTVDATNISITTGINRTNFTDVKVIFEYLNT